ncbi:DUF4185 domain-containing protein [Streptomyces sp. NPDC032198]|uniref:DUF4185 domain-containing protein n=1 Tax=Streptomyces sp. NPDC032198 TaxID=3155127 RepID=UPI0033E3E79A
MSLKQALLMLLASVLLLCSFSPSAMADSDTTRKQSIDISVPDGLSSNSRLTEEERRKISAYASEAPRELDASAPGSMQFCWDKVKETGLSDILFDHFTWCKVRTMELADIECTNGRCEVVGVMQWRVSLLGLGNQGSSTTERKMQIFLLLDNPVVVSGNPRGNARLKAEALCSPINATVGCGQSSTNGRIDSLDAWKLHGSAMFDFQSNSTDLVKYNFDIMLSLPDQPVRDDTHDTISGVKFRCDSEADVSGHGCVFLDAVPIWRLTADSAVKESADLIWTAQNRPMDTIPRDKVKKIPGSIKSNNPLTRLPESLKKKNHTKSVAACKLYRGKGYTRGGTWDCDEYPFQSTREGSYYGDAVREATSHFAVEAMPSGPNRTAGARLGGFYKTQRILYEDRFFVHVVTASGGDYNGPDKPSGAAAPVQYSQCQSSSMVEAQQTERNAYPEDLFNKYASTTRDGWTGGDSTYSVTLPDGRRLWLFSDTFIGPLDSDGKRPTSAPLINSSFVSQVGDNLTTITGGSSSSPKAIMPPPAEDHWYWLGDGQVTTIDGKKYLQVIFHEWHKFGPGNWDFRFEKAMVATFDPNSLSEPEWIEPLPADAGVQWGAAVMSAEQSGDGYSYIYGVEDAKINKGMRVARVKGTNLADASKWQYLNTGRSQWMYGETEGDNVTRGIANEYSVTPHKGSFVLVSQDSTQAFSGKIRMWTGCDPFGPFGSWDGHDEVYRMPEPGPIPFGDCVAGQEDGRCFSYNAHVHPSLASGDRWTLSYNVNNFDNRVTPDGAHYRDPTIYRPRFVSFKLVSSNVLRKDARLNFSAKTPPVAQCRPERQPRAGVLAMPPGRPCP